MKFTSILSVAATFCFAIASIGCGSTANTAANTSTNKTNTAVVTNATTTNTAANTAANTNTASNTETSKADSVGVPECDEYIQKYEACLTMIAAKAPQAQPGLKSAFEAQRSGFKAAASTPQGKTILASQCKGFIETAKTSTKQWCDNW